MSKSRDFGVWLGLGFFVFMPILALVYVCLENVVYLCIFLYIFVKKFFFILRFLSKFKENKFSILQFHA